MRTKPTPNSTAEKIRKKKVRERILRLSYARPNTKVSAYNVIHRSSAVRRRWRDVLVWVAKVISRNKKNVSMICISPKNKIT